MLTTFDIMLPYYGDVALMQAAVHSVLAQTDSDWRLVVVDDGKEPGVPEWFAELGDDRVSYQRNEENLGVTRNYQKCLGLVESEHFVMMGTDDVMLPNYLATVRAALQAHPGVAMVQPGVEVIDSAGQVSRTLTDEVKRRLYAPRVDGRLLLGGEELAANLLRGNWLYFPSLCWRTDAVRKWGFRAEYEIIQDLALIVDLLQDGEQMLVEETLSFQYRRHAVSISSATAFSGYRFQESARYYADVAARLDAHGWPRAAKAARSHSSSRLQALAMLPGALRAGRSDGARKLLRHAAGADRLG